ncbi:hypothetical protein PRIPAC_86078 [Pristionchus pacificus]|uniref:Uncharacterized protein n=1 Tax=Pristionchus pacificus TaxID=54126 RepID=A0A2A6BTC9_PRIPA|nr:hypothetical protein PRIPAC_86078 [Pristionchus pacificus]|eukprot:PDM69138.1 hypothetical protein PRIPAC_47440 [Pristionchus pacificus]
MFSRVLMTMGKFIFHANVPLAPDGVTSKTDFRDFLTLLVTEKISKICFRRDAIWSQWDVDIKNENAHRHQHPREPQITCCSNLCPIPTQTASYERDRERIEHLWGKNNRTTSLYNFYNCVIIRRRHPDELNYKLGNLEREAREAQLRAGEECDEFLANALGTECRKRTRREKRPHLIRMTTTNDDAIVKVVEGCRAESGRGGNVVFNCVFFKWRSSSSLIKVD